MNNNEIENIYNQKKNILIQIQEISYKENQLLKQQTKILGELVVLREKQLALYENHGHLTGQLNILENRKENKDVKD